MTDRQCFRCNCEWPVMAAGLRAWFAGWSIFQVGPKIRVCDLRQYIIKKPYDFIQNLHFWGRPTLLGWNIRHKIANIELIDTLLLSGHNPMTCSIELEKSLGKWCDWPNSAHVVSCKYVVLGKIKITSFIASQLPSPETSHDDSLISIAWS